jgi:hypothetical protein
MKKALLTSALIAACALALNSCDKVKTSTPLTINWDGIDVTVTVPAVSDTTPQTGLGTGTFSYDIDSLIKDKSSNALSISNIDSIVINSCTITVLNPDAGNNGQNVKHAHVLFYTDTHPATVEIGNAIDNPDTYSDNIPCTVPKNVLKDYFQAGDKPTVHYRLDGQLRRPTTHPLDLKIHVTYTLHGVIKA